MRRLGEAARKGPPVLGFAPPEGPRTQISWYQVPAAIIGKVLVSNHVLV